MLAKEILSGRVAVTSFQKSFYKVFEKVQFLQTSHKYLSTSQRTLSPFCKNIFSSSSYLSF